jgi:hypothetical protein
MSEVWTVAMMVSGGLFVGGVVSIAWERLPAWRSAPLTQFRGAFAHTLRRVDRLQPATLSILLVSTVGFAVSADGMARSLGWIAAAGFFGIMVGSVAWLVPLQRRITSGSAVGGERLRNRWLRGHQIRTVAAVALFIVAAAATTI